MIHTLADIRNKECTACKFGDCTKNVCQVKEVVHTEGDVLMVVGDFPGKSDCSNDTVMQSGKESLFWEMALGSIVGAQRWQFYPTYAVKCRTIEADIPGKTEIAACSQYLMNEIRLLKPKAILLLGSVPMQSFGLKGKISNVRGSVIDFTIDDFTTKLVPTYAPMFVLNNRSQLVNFTKDIDKAYTLATGVVKEPETSQIVMVETLEGVQEAIDYCLETRECCFDFETTEIDEDLGTYAEGFRATLLSLSFQHGSSYTIPLEHDESPFDKKQVKHIIGMVSKQLFQNPDIRKIGHGIKYDMGVAAHYGYPVFRGRLDDTMLMHHLIDETLEHGLKPVTTTYYPLREGYEDEVKKHGYGKAPMKILAPYGGTDTDSTFRVCTILEQKLLRDKRLYSVYRNQVMLALRPLFNAERIGMSVDRPLVLRNIERAKYLLNKQAQVLLNYPEIKKFEAIVRQKKIKETVAKYEASKEGKKGKNLSNVEDKIAAIKAGTKVVYEGMEITAAQIGEFMYSKDGLGYPLPYERSKHKYTKTTDARYIKRYVDHTGFIKDLLIWRSISTNINTFMVGLLEQMDSKDRVHTTFAQHGTVTGRLASKKPNLQNIPKHVKIENAAVEEVVGMVMRSFNVPKGYALMALDFSQAELRIIAELAGEQTMIDAYNAGIDLHALTASILVGKTLEEFYKLPKKEIKALRQKAKAANFGLIYGQEALGFMEYAETNYGVKMTLQEATQIRNTFFAKYPKLREYHATYIGKAKKFGYVRTIFGRKRHAKNINDADEYIRGQDEREAINHPVQGSCGEMTIFTFGLNYFRLPSRCLFVNTVHDSLLYYVPLDLVPYCSRIAKYTAENLPTKHYFGKGLEKLKLVADVEMSTTNWKELTPYKEQDWIEFKTSKIDSFYSFIEEKEKELAN